MKASENLDIGINITILISKTAQLIVCKFLNISI